HCELSLETKENPKRINNFVENKNCLVFYLKLLLKHFESGSISLDTYYIMLLEKMYSTLFIFDVAIKFK
ncbi:hypothetical protein Avbf_12258, partial [Armadillidium vulgare]